MMSAVCECSDVMSVVYAVLCSVTSLASAAWSPFMRALIRFYSNKAMQR